MYNIAIVDEEKDDIRRFQLYVHRNDTEKKFNVVPFEPESDINSLAQRILSSGIDAIVSDYRLNEFKSDVTYTGVELVNLILQKRHEFPCFVLTSFDDDAAKKSNDVNIVYIKSILNGSESDAKVNFIYRVELQILKYKSKVESAKRELETLIAKRKVNPLSIADEDKFVELSHFMDGVLVGEESLPRSFYSNDTNAKLDSLINLSDQILKKLDEENELSSPARKDTKKKKK